MRSHNTTACTVHAYTSCICVRTSANCIPRCGLYSDNGMRMLASWSSTYVMADSISAWTPSPEVDRMMYEDLHLTDPPPAYLRHGTHTSKRGRRGKVVSLISIPQSQNLRVHFIRTQMKLIFYLSVFLQFSVYCCICALCRSIYFESIRPQFSLLWGSSQTYNTGITIIRPLQIA